MVTIEERSKESMRLHLDESFETFNKANNGMREWQFGYCQGATEQKQIDIDKAVEWLRENIRPWYKFSIDTFRKAMTKEE